MYGSLLSCHWIVKSGTSWLCLVCLSAFGFNFSNGFNIWQCAILGYMCQRCVLLFFQFILNKVRPLEDRTNVSSAATQYLNWVLHSFACCV